MHELPLTCSDPAASSPRECNASVQYFLLQRGGHKGVYDGYDWKSHRQPLQCRSSRYLATATMWLTHAWCCYGGYGSSRISLDGC